MKKVFLLAIPLLIGSIALIQSQTKTDSLANSKTVPNVEATKNTVDGLTVNKSLGSILQIDNLDDLIAKSDLVVIGKTDKSVTEVPAIITRDFEGFPYETISEVPFKVSKVFKGDGKLQTVQVGQQAALVEQNGKKVVQTFEEYRPMQPGKKYVLFLKKSLPGGSAEGKNLYFPTGVMYGKYNVDGTDSQEEQAFPEPTYKEIKKQVKDRFKE